MAGRTFIDIGCGSGLHALAAAQLGVSRILAVDIDAASVATCKALLNRHGVSIPFDVERASVFDLGPRIQGAFDIVYSWGVLHHTGAMHEAITKAAAMVAPGGLFAFALYRTTRMDWFWKPEKRWYSRTWPAMQTAARAAYIGIFAVLYSLRGKNFRRFLSDYRSTRGMDYFHDVHDWLGGYPYEAILAPEVDTIMNSLGFETVRVFSRPLSLGLMGSGCDEYVYRKRIDASEISAS